MKKHILFALAFTIGISAVTQKKELRTAKKALAKENYEKAGVALDAVEALLGSIDAKYESDYYLYRSIFYSKSGGVPKEEILNAEFSDVEKSIAALEFVTASSDVTLLRLHRRRLISHLVNSGNTLSDENDFETSSNYFEVAYNLSPSDTLYLFIAANHSVRIKQNDRALVLYEKLRDLQFTGIEKKMFATNVENQKKEFFTDKKLMNLLVKNGDYKNPTEELSKSLFPQIIKNIAFIYKNKGENDKALEAFVIARAGDPESMDLLLQEAYLHYNMGNITKFKELLELAVQKDPNNPELQYNLGIISADAKDFENSKKFYLRAIELKPDYTDAYINLAVVILEPEVAMVEKLNELSYSNKRSDYAKYDELIEKKKLLYLEAIPYLKKGFKNDPTNYNIAKKIYEMMEAVGSKEANKYKELKNSLQNNQ